MPGRSKTPHLFTIEDRGFETPCWIWARATCAGAKYGNMKRDGRNIVAHRWVYSQKYGPIPAGKQLDHRCEPTLCVNPDHLEPVTGAENTRRGRATKLTLAQVTEIRARLAAGEAPCATFAAEYGVETLHIWRIKKRLAWATA